MYIPVPIIVEHSPQTQFHAGVPIVRLRSILCTEQFLINTNKGVFNIKSKYFSEGIPIMQAPNSSPSVYLRDDAESGKLDSTLNMDLVDSPDSPENSETDPLVARLASYWDTMDDIEATVSEMGEFALEARLQHSLNLKTRTKMFPEDDGINKSVRSELETKMMMETSQDPGVKYMLIALRQLEQAQRVFKKEIGKFIIDLEKEPKNSPSPKDATITDANFLLPDGTTRADVH